MRAIPEALLRDLQAVKGFDQAAFLQAHAANAVTSIRRHPIKQSEAYIDHAAVPWCKDGRYLEERPVFTLDPLFHAGAYYVQEASSMFLDHLVRAIFPDRDNLRVLDLCAAPGGKSTLLASLLGSNSLLISNEVIRTRAPILEENMTRWGYMNTWVTGNDAKDFGRLPGYFDLAVVDAPCSGSGLFRKDARAIDEWSEANVALCSQRQQRILADMWPSLKEDGILIYATCSYSPAEDEEILDWLADTFSAEGIETYVPEEWGIVKTHSARNHVCGYRFFPDKINGEGFFIAAMRKRDVSTQVRYPRFKTEHTKKAFGEAGYLLSDEDWLCIPGSDKMYRAIRGQHEMDLQLLRQGLYLRKFGVELGTPSAKEWLPSHDVALSVNKSIKLPIINLTKDQALRYLKKEEIILPSVAKGWYIAAFDGLGLGWLKVLDSRSNNYLPKNWRIRMDISGLE